MMVKTLSTGLKLEVFPASNGAVTHPQKEGETTLAAHSTFIGPNIIFKRRQVFVHGDTERSS